MLVKDQPENLPTTNALDQLPKQGALIEAAFVRFSGGSGGALEAPPAKNEQRTYIVKATCIRHIDEVRKDNEDRLTVVMEIDELYEKGKQPDVDKNQGSLFVAGGTDSESDDSDGDSDDSGS